MHSGKKPSSDSKKYPPDSIRGRLRERKIIATFAAFIGGGWLIYEVVHWVLVDHYHLPKTLKDITLVTFLGALSSTLIWLWFRGAEKRHGNVKIEVLTVPLIILLTLTIDLEFLFKMFGVSLNWLLIGIVALSMGIAWVVFKSLQWAAGIPDSDKPDQGPEPPKKEPSHLYPWNNSIVVLPFVNTSADPEQEYFCDGMTEEIINALTHIRDLKVIARTSAFAFKNRHEDVRDIGRKLDVEHLLEGSVRKSGNRLRINAQLVRVADGSHLWSERYDREMEDIFSVQDEITLAIVDQLKIKLLGREKEAVTKRYTDNPELFNLYLFGLYHWYRFTEKDLDKSEEYFEKALRKDPNYALAYAGVAEVNLFKPFFVNLPPKKAIPKARTYLKKALDIDQNLAEAHAILGRISLFYDWDWQKADQEFKRALELNPNSALIHSHYAVFFSIKGRHKLAISQAKRARELDPLSIFLNADVGERILHAGYFKEAIEDLQNTITMDPNYFYSHHLLGNAYWGLSMSDESIAAYQKAFDLSEGTPLVACFLAITLYLVGEKHRAEELFHGLKIKAKHEYIPPTFFFSWHKARKEMDNAFEWFEQACECRDIYLPFCLNWPTEFFQLPDDKRYAELLDRKGLLDKMGFKKRRTVS